MIGSQHLRQQRRHHRDGGRLVIDRVVRNYLINAAHAAGADPDLTVHDALAAVARSDDERSALPAAMVGRRTGSLLSWCATTPAKHSITDLSAHLATSSELLTRYNALS